MPLYLPSRRIGPITLAVASPRGAAEAVVDLALSGQPNHVHFCNAYTVALADRDPDYATVFQLGATNFPDGKPLAWISRIRRDRPPLQQVRGPSAFKQVLSIGQSRNIKHYLLGSTPEVLSRLERNILATHRGAQIVGIESPPFRPATTGELRARDERILDSGAQIVWVGLGTPKQDYEALRLAQAIPVTAVAVGAAFDFVAGTVREAPQFMTLIGLEWLYRLVREPRRMWRRYLIGNPQFLAAAVKGSRSRRANEQRQ